MVFYHTIVQLFKIKQDRKPVYLSEKISNEFKHKTRLAKGNGIRETENMVHPDSNKTMEQFTSVTKVFCEPEAIQEGTESVCKKKCKHYINFNYE